MRKIVSKSTGIIDIFVAKRSSRNDENVMSAGKRAQMVNRLATSNREVFGRKRRNHEPMGIREGGEERNSDVRAGFPD